MKNNQSIISTNAIVEKIYTIVLSLYIIIVPIINSINKVFFLGYGMHVWAVVAVIVMTFAIAMFSDETKRNKIGFPILILVVFLLEILYHKLVGKRVEMGVILFLLLYVALLKIPTSISIKTIYEVFFISALVAAIFSLIGGLTQGGITRTATKVDGSIAIIVILIAFFGKEPFPKTHVYNILKYTAIASCFVVAFFGMSRARLLLIAIIILIKILLAIRTIAKTKRINISVLWWVPVVAITLMVVLSMDTTRQLINSITDRFQVGFESLGRDDEIKVGWDIFLNHPILGNGWGQMQFTDYNNYLSNYYNHCMYIAILARGGIVLGVPFLLSFVSIIINVIKSKNIFCIIAIASFFALGYGNAGVFNYTITSMLIPVMLNLSYSAAANETNAGALM